MLERVATLKHMRAIGRLGGLRGGVARAKALDPSRRSEISRDAARARWKPEVLTLTQPRDDGEVERFVAFYGNGFAKHGACDPAAVLVSAISACRNNACLARMIPVFIWRARLEIFDGPNKIADATDVVACALGYFLELADRFGAPRGGVRGAPNMLRSLRRKIGSITTPIVLFRSMDRPMFMEHAARLTSPTAKAWKLVVGEPDESFESYFNRKVDHGPL